MIFKNFGMVEDMNLGLFVIILDKQMVQEVASPYDFKTSHVFKLSRIETPREFPGRRAKHAAVI
jgi:hypothetical protein